MHTPEKIAHLRTELIGHLQAALAISKETGDARVNDLIGIILEQIRSTNWHIENAPKMK